MPAASKILPAKGMPLVYTVLLAMPLFYSSNMVIGRAAVAETGPWTLAFFRWGIALAILALLGRRDIKAAWPTILGAWRLFVLLGLLGMVLCGGMLYWALEYTTATNATLIYTTAPIVIVLLERLFGDERLSPWRWLGIGLAFLGVVIIVFRADVGRLLALRLNPGDAVVLLAAISWAGYSVLLKRPTLREMPGAASFAAIAGAGTLLLLPFMLAEIWVAGRGLPSSASAWNSIVALAIIPSVLAFGAYQYGVERVGATRTGVFLYLLPAYGVVLAVVFLGESFEPYHALGFACIMAGILTVTAPGLQLARGGQRTV
jgi:drug/metabolite transporter (DMT)-like permease